MCEGYRKCGRCLIQRVPHTKSPINDIPQYFCFIANMDMHFTWTVIDLDLHVPNQSHVTGCVPGCLSGHPLGRLDLES